MIYTEEFDYDILLKRLEAKQPFDFARIGDGESNAMFQDCRQPMNKDKHNYYPDMGERLLDIVKSCPTYHLGLQGLAYRQRTETFDNLSAEFGTIFCKSDFIHHANIKGRIQPFFDVLKTRDVVLIGNKNLERLDKFDFEFYEIPMINAWLSYDKIKADIERFMVKDKVVLYCAGMMAGILIDDFQGRCTQVDVGSAFDIWVGVISRGYHESMKV